MNACPNCAAEIIPGARFCHRCGDAIREKVKPCPVCHENNPIASVFCHHCGFHFEGKQQQKQGYAPLYAFAFDQKTLAEQVKSHFFKGLRKRVEEEHDLARYSEFVERYYRSRFPEVYEARAAQIADTVWVQWDRFGNEALPEIDRIIQSSFEGLLDYFIIQYCPDLIGMVLPETILKYDRIPIAQANPREMVADYLAFHREKEQFYFDFIAMPAVYLENACKQFLVAEKGEEVYFICDLSLKGNCREGFALTNKAIYWRNTLGKARMAPYNSLKTLQLGKDWLLINGHFFTANPGLNLKLYKLLKKLRHKHNVPEPA